MSTSETLLKVDCCIYYTTYIIQKPGKQEGKKRERRKDFMSQFSTREQDQQDAHIFLIIFFQLNYSLHSNKSTNQMHQSLSFIACRLNTPQHISGHPHAHHQELINCSSRLWFTVGTWW
jgi:hypothetical protein